MVLPSDQWSPVHPGPLVLGVLVSDAEPEGVPVASGQEVPHEALAGGAAGGQGRTSCFRPAVALLSPTCSSAVVMMARWPPLLLQSSLLPLQLFDVFDTM